MFFVSLGDGDNVKMLSKHHTAITYNAQSRAGCHAYPVCHREERSDAATSLNCTTIPSAMRLPRYARNDNPVETGYA